MPRRTADPITNATTGAALAKALKVEPKTLRAYLRRNGTRLAQGDKITPEVRNAAKAHFAKKAK